jgi:ribosome modulation factor
MNAHILALVSQGEQSHIAVLLAQRALDRLQREVADAQSKLTTAEHSYHELALSAATATGLARPAFDDLIQKRVTVLVDLGLIGDIEITTTDLSAGQTPVSTVDTASPARVSLTPAPNNPYGDDQPRSRSAYQKGYDDGNAGQEPDLNLYKRPSAQEAYLKGHQAAVEDNAGGNAGADGPSVTSGDAATPPEADTSQAVGEASGADDAALSADVPAPGAALVSEASPASDLSEATVVDPAVEDTTPAAASVERASAQDESPTFSPDGIFLQKAQAEGAQAAVAGEPLSACPYVEGPLRQAWEAGYHGALDQRLEQMSSPEADLIAADHGSVVVLETAASLTTSHFSQSLQPDPSIFAVDDEDPFGPAPGLADQVTIVAQDNLEIPPFLRREGGVH